MFAELIAALPHNIHEEDAALARVHHVFEGGSEKIMENATTQLWFIVRHFPAPADLFFDTPLDCLRAR